MSWSEEENEKLVRIIRRFDSALCMTESLVKWAKAVHDAQKRRFSVGRGERKFPEIYI